MRSTALEPTKGRSSDHPDAGTRPAAKEREEEGLRTGTHATAPTALVVRSQGLRTEAANRERLTAPLEAAWSSDRARREMKPWLRKEAARTFGSAQGRTFGSGRGRTFGSGQRPQGAAERSPHAPRTFGNASDGARPALRGRFDETFGSSRSDRAERETTPTDWSLRAPAGRTFGQAARTFGFELSDLRVQASESFGFDFGRNPHGFDGDSNLRVWISARTATATAPRSSDRRAEAAALARARPRSLKLRQRASEPQPRKSFGDSETFGIPTSRVYEPAKRRRSSEHRSRASEEAPGARRSSDRRASRIS